MTFGLLKKVAKILHLVYLAVYDSVNRRHILMHLNIKVDMKKTFTNQWTKIAIVGILLTFATLWGNSLSAQTNLAPLATTNGQGSGGITPYLWNWNTINDGNLGTCGTQTAFIWTNSPPNGTEYMEWEWSQQYPIDKITIHHAETGGRFLTGGTIQYWNGSTWVNHHTFSGLPQVCTNDVTFPICVTNKLRIANWVPGTGQNSNLNYREIQIWQGARPGTHAQLLNTGMKALNCGSTTDSVSIEVRNIGLTTLTTFWVGTTVTGTVNGSAFSLTDSVQYNGSLITGKTVVMNVGRINNINGSNVTISSWVKAPGDGDPTDDVRTINLTTLGGVTSNPTPANNSRCGSGSVTLAGGAVSGNTVFWYDQPTGGNLLGIGSSFKTPDVPAPTSRTFYAAGAKISGDSTLTTGYSGTNFAGAGFAGGSMFDVSVKKGLVIDSFGLHINQTNMQRVTIYMKTGSYSGSATNAGAWTLVERKEIRSKGFGVPTSFTLSKPLVLPEGNYAFYIYANENLIFQQIARTSSVIENTAIATLHGEALRDTFATIFVPTTNQTFSWNGSIYYHEACPSGNRLPVVATAKPLAVGATFAKGSNFKGTYDAGTTNQPDVVANPDEIEYEITPPTGFLNSNYGSSGTWVISSVIARTVNGTTIPSGDITLTNPGSANGKLKYKPSASYTDSMIRVLVNIRRNDNGCDTVLERYIFVAPRPDADFTFTTPCDGDYVDFTNGSTIQSGTISYDWRFGDGNSSNNADPSHLYGTFGTYNVKLYVTSNYGYVDSITKSVIVNRVPTAGFIFTNACEGTAVTMTDASTMPSGTPSYVWDYGDQSVTGTGATTSKSYAQPGIYPVTLTVTVNGCSNTITQYVTQAPRGVPSFTVDLGNCDNKDVKFTNTSTKPEFGDYAYQYKFGDGNSATGAVVVHTYNTFSSYNAVLVASTELGCVDSAVVSVSLRESPKPVFAATGGTCTNEILNFSNTTNVPAGSMNTYEWSFGDAFTSTDATPSHTYAAAGTYTVKLKAISTNGCEGVKESDVTVNLKPTADFVVDRVCLGKASEFKNNSTISAGTLSYTWNFGNSNTSTATNPSETYTSAGNYNVTMIASTAAGCSDTAVATAEVAAIPAVNIGIASNLTGDGTMKFSTNTQNVTYKWLFGDGGSSEVQNPVYKFPFGAKWSVKLIVTSPEGCVNMASTDVFVNPLSAESVNNANMVVYPNPASGRFFIRYNGNSSITAVKVTDILGKKVAEIEPVSTTSEVSFDISQYNAGIYLVTITDADGKTYSQKVTLAK